MAFTPKLVQQGASGSLSDIYFNYVTMLLHGDGTNGAQNNTFLDSSSNAFSITRNGNTTQGTFSPYGSNWSNYFDGSNGLNDTGAGLIGTSTSTFTVEAWVNLSAAPSGSADHGSLVGLDANFTTTTNYLSFGPNTSRQLRLFWFDGSNKTCTGSTTLSVGVWYHIALVVNSNAITMYVNGVAETLSGTTTLTNRSGTSGQFNIGKNGQTQFIGYASNVRISNNARTITVPTSPYTSDANTLVLACNENRSPSPATGTSAITWETIGGSIQRFSPFAPTAAYSAATIGGSGYFDGTGDYLSVAGLGSSYSGDITIEAYCYLTVAFPTAASESLFGPWQTGTQHILLRVDSSSLELFLAGSSIFSVDVSSYFRASSWNHIAVSRSSGTLKAFVNGTQVFSGADSTSINLSSLVIAAERTTGINTWDGYLSSVRISNSARYTAAFTPSSTPFTSDGNTLLLLNFTNAGIIDNAMMNDLETVGNAQISTSVMKYGTGSIYVDGTGDWLFARSSPNISLSGNFTIEGWVYQVSNGTSATLLCIGDSDVTGGIALYLDTTSSPTGPRLSLLYNSAILNGSTAAAINTWHHIAAVRSGSTITLFLNGVSQGTVSASTTFTGNLLVGATLFAGTTYPANNYIDDLRITKGYARYTSGFTVSNRPFLDK